MGDRKAPSIPPKPPRKPPAPPAPPRKAQDPFSRFLRAMFDGKVTELHIKGDSVIETADGRRVAQTAMAAVVAGDGKASFDLVSGRSLLSQVESVFGLHMDRVDMLLPDPPTTGQKIAATEGDDA